MNRLAFLLLCVMLSSVAAWAGQPVDQTIPASADASVEIEIVAGSVEVKGWNRNEVKVTGTVGDDTEGLSVSGTGDSISLEVKIPQRRDESKRERDTSAQLEVWVPANSRLEVETVSAAIDVSGVSGHLELESVSGNVEASGEPEQASFETVSGSIHFEGSSTRVEAESVSGSVMLDGVAGAVDVETVSGKINIGGGGLLEEVTIESVSGALNFDGGLAPGASVDVEVHSSNVTLTLPAGTSASFDVSTFSGAVDNDFGPAAERSDKHAPPKSLEFSTGDASAEISIETFSGNVALRQR